MNAKRLSFSRHVTHWDELPTPWRVKLRFDIQDLGHPRFKNDYINFVVSVLAREPHQKEKSLHGTIHHILRRTQFSSTSWVAHTTIFNYIGR